MCQMRSPVPPTSYDAPTPPPFNRALALYPTLNSDSQETSPSQSDPNLHLAGLLVPGAAEAFGRVWNSKVPKEFMAPELPPMPVVGPGGEFAAALGVRPCIDNQRAHLDILDGIEMIAESAQRMQPGSDQAQPTRGDTRAPGLGIVGAQERDRLAFLHAGRRHRCRQAADQRQRTEIR